MRFSEKFTRTSKRRYSLLNNKSPGQCIRIHAIGNDDIISAGRKTLGTTNTMSPSSVAGSTIRNIQPVQEKSIGTTRFLFRFTSPPPKKMVTIFMPGILLYRSFLFLTWAYANLSGDFNKEEIVFHSLLIEFHFLFPRKPETVSLKYASVSHPDMKSSAPYLQQ